MAPIITIDRNNCIVYVFPKTYNQVKKLKKTAFLWAH